jgi:hypothetical protein
MNNKKAGLTISHKNTRHNPKYSVTLPICYLERKRTEYVGESQSIRHVVFEINATALKKCGRATVY